MALNMKDVYEQRNTATNTNSCPSPQVHDGSPLRLWKASVEVPAPVEEVLSRVLREQQHWDEDLLEGRVVESLEERAEVYQYVRNSMAPHPPRDHVVLR